jgi:hypothetical protein
VDVLCSRLIVSTTALEVHGKVTLGHEPKPSGPNGAFRFPLGHASERAAPDRRSWGSEPDALMFTRLARWAAAPLDVRPRGVAASRRARAGLDGFTFHGLRHSFVAILVAAGCNVARSRSRPGTTALPLP